jgi:hypothetical protein
VGWLATAAILYWCVTSWTTPLPDPTTRLFSVVTLLVIVVCTAYGTRARPRLSASGDGIEIRGLGRPRRHPWADVIEMRMLHTPGLARRSRTLEITAGHGPDERLYIFGRLDLGTDPQDVLDALTAVRPNP